MRAPLLSSWPPERLRELVYRRARPRVAIALVVLVATLVGGTWAVQRTAWGQARLQDVLTRVLRQELGLEGRVERLGVRFFPLPSIEATGIALSDPVYGPLVEADALRVRPSVGALLAGRLDLHRIEVVRPRVRLVVRDGEVRNLPRPPGARGGGGGELELPFQQLDVRDARLTVDAGDVGEAELRGVDLALDERRDGTLALRVSAAGGRLRHANGSETLQTFSAELRVAPDRLELDRVALQTPFFSLDVRDGRVRLPDGGAVDGHVRASVDLGRLATLPLPLEGLPPLDGVVTVDGFAELAGPDRWSAHATVTVDGVHVEQFGLGRMTFEVTATPQEIRIREGLASLVRRGGLLEIAGRIGLEGGLETELHLGVRELQFEKLMEQLGVTPDGLVSWVWNGRIDLAGTLDPLDLRGPGDLDTRDFLVSQNAWHERVRERVIGVERARVTTRVRIQPDGIHLDDTLVASARSRLRADALLGFDNQLRVDGATEGPGIDLRDVTPLIDIPLDGRAEVTVDIDGTFKRPEIRGSARIAGFHFGTFPLGDVTGTYVVENEVQTVRFPSLEATKRASRYRADDLVLDFRDDRFLVHAAVRADPLELEDFYHVFHYEDDERFDAYAGTTRGLIDVTFTRGYPGDGPEGTMVAELDLEVPEATLTDYAFTDGTFRGRWRWLDWPRGTDGGILEIDHASLRKGDGTLLLAGRVDLGSKVAVTAVADRFALAELEGVGDRFPGIEGLLALTADVRGTLSVPLAHVDAQLTAVRWQGRHLGDGRLYVRLTDASDPWVAEAATWRFDGGGEPPPEAAPCPRARAGFAQGSWPPDPPVRTLDGLVPALERPMAFLVCGEALGGKVALDLAVGRTAAFPLRGTVRLDGLPLDPFFPRTGGPSAEGEVSGVFAFDGGALLAPEGLEGEVRLARLVVRQGGVELWNEGPVRVRLDRGGFEVERAEFAGRTPDDDRASVLSMRGGGSYADGLATTVEGHVDLGVLATLTPVVSQADGRLDLRVNVGGPWSDPEVYGEAQVARGLVRVVGLPFAVEDVNGRVRFSARRVLVEHVRARVGTGTVEVAGEATLADLGLDRYRLAVEGDGIAYEPIDGLELGVGLRTTLAWARGQDLPLLEGTVYLDRVLYTRPIELSQSLDDLSRTRRTQVDRFDPRGGALALDLRIVERAPILVANNLIDAEVRIADEEQPFRIVGTDERYGALGTLVIPRGVVHFRNSDFDVRRGTVTFRDPNALEPEFEVEATTEILRTADFAGVRWLVTLLAHGTPSAFELETRSDPPLSQEDLVLLLTVGMTRAEAQQLQAGDLTGTAALEALAAVSGVDREIQRAVPVIDDFGISSRYSPLTNRTEPQISIGKRITDRVRLSAATGLGQTREVRTSIEWRLDDQTSVQALYDNVDTTGGNAFGNVGVDLRWRLEFE